MKFLPQPSQFVKYRSTIAAAAVLLIIILTPHLVPGQVDPQGRRDPNRPLTDAERQRKLDRDVEDREQEMRMIDRMAKADERPGPGTRRRVLVADIQKEAQQLQEANVKLQQAIHSAGAPEYGRIAGYASDIRKAADRLQNDLALPKPEQQEKQRENDQSPTDERLRTSIQTLDLSIKSFESNDILQRPGAVDVQLFTKAAQDLSETLLHSARIKKLADALRKSEVKTRAVSVPQASSTTSP